MLEAESSHFIVVIGASAGGVQALQQLVQHLPSNLPASLLIVVHQPADLPCFLPHILRRAGNLPATHAVDVTAIEPGHIYSALPDRHLLVEPGLMRVVFGPKENRFRPAIDPLFRTAAEAYGDRVIGVLLSGALYDGTAGLYDIKQQGGITIVQDPDEALMPYLPRHAIKHVELDHVLPVAEIAQTLVKYCQLRLQKGSIRDVK